MSDLDDVEEISLACNKTGSARKSRSARKLLIRTLENFRKRPKWRRQLAATKRKTRAL